MSRPRPHTEWCWEKHVAGAACSSQDWDHPSDDAWWLNIEENSPGHGRRESWLNLWHAPAMPAEAAVVLALTLRAASRRVFKDTAPLSQPISWTEATTVVVPPEWSIPDDEGVIHLPTAKSVRIVAAGLLALAAGQPVALRSAS